MHGCEKSGIGQHFQAYLKNEDKRNQLVTFGGHRYNHLFCAAGRTYHHRNDIKNFSDSLSDPNDLMKSVAFDIQEQVFLSSVRPLGIIDKLITGVLQLKLEEYSKDSTALLEEETLFPDEMLAKMRCFIHSSNLKM
ncbi:hypothetical protein MAR_013218 [Mya arenaria]|uniref:Uncharacterized protein n=1 Tax=Mya arenaria TaxID=6604 RepID=A0ABY7G2M7_MYAAR|nr:hypothetical protein MAR_013218 [Mya arenaria]